MSSYDVQFVELTYSSMFSFDLVNRFENTSFNVITVGPQSKLLPSLSSILATLPPNSLLGPIDRPQVPC